MAREVEEREGWSCGSDGSRDASFPSMLRLILLFLL